MLGEFFQNTDRFLGVGAWVDVYLREQKSVNKCFEQ